MENIFEEQKCDTRENLLVIEFWNVTPHLETSLEIAIRAAHEGHNTTYVHWGRCISYNECYLPCHGEISREKKLIELACPTFMCVGETDWIENVPVFKIDQHVQSASHLVRLEYDSQNIGSILYSNLSDITSNFQPVPKDNKELLQKMLETYIKVYVNTKELIARYNPSKVVLFNGRHVAPAAVLAACNKLMIETYFHERGGSNDRFIVSKRPIHNISNYQILLQKTWENKSHSYADSIEIGKQIFHKRLMGYNQEGPSFVSSFTNNPLMLKDIIYVSFFSSSMDEISYVPNPLEVPRYPWSCQVSAAIVLASIFAQHQSVNLLIRLHPNLANKTHEERWMWSNINWPRNCTVYLPDSNVNSYEIIRNCAAVFSYGSTVSVESVALGVNSYSLGPSLGDYLKSVKTVSGIRELKYIAQKIANRDNVQFANKLDAYKFFYSSANVGLKFKYYDPINFNEGKFMGTRFR